MKTANEIQEKIRELMEKAGKKPRGAEKEELYCNIDALLWVLGDESGKPI